MSANNKEQGLPHALPNDFNEKATIFLDMDGVMVDFFGGVRSLLGFPDDVVAERYDLPSHFPNHTEDTIKQAILMRGPSFWAELPALPFARAIYANCIRYANTYFLTSPWGMEDAYSGKVSWLSRNLEISRNFVVDHILVTDSKSLLAGPSRVLIDDLTYHCNDWSREGGISINYPAPWNDVGKVSKFDPLMHTQQMLMYAFKVLLNKDKPNSDGGVMKTSYERF